MDYSCLSSVAQTNWNINGANLGGFLVLEPWITPSLFYQFTNTKDQFKIGMDMYSFCDILKEDGYTQLEEHFQKWITEEDIINLKNSEITHVRIPLGDWMFDPYEPYIGCTDNSIFHLDRVLGYCEKHNIKVLLDLHGVRGSQNGLDNSGKTEGLEFSVGPDFNYHGILTFRHWPIRDAKWAGTYDHKENNYTWINYDNIENTKNVLYKIIDTYKNHPTIFGIEPLNEPWQYIPEKLLKDFYYDVYKYMSTYAPHWKFIYHDSFRPTIWNNFIINCSNAAIDWHSYQAWKVDRFGDLFLIEADSYKNVIENYKKSGIQVVVGEWSIATDNCAMWLNGFQDNLEGYPVTDCKYTQCPIPYINVEDIDRTSALISPFGTGKSSPRLGTCPYDGTLLVISKSEDKFLNDLALRSKTSFDTGQGHFFWNFKTEIKEEIKWNYLEAYKKGYFTEHLNIDYNKIIYYVFATICCVSIIIILTILYKFYKEPKKIGYIYVKNKDDSTHGFIPKSRSQPANFDNYMSITKANTNDMINSDFAIDNRKKSPFIV